MEHRSRFGVAVVVPLLLAAGPLASGAARAQVVPGRDDGRSVGPLEAEYRAYILEEIGPLLADWRAAWLIDDPDAVGRAYAEDALLVPDGGAPLLGRGRIERYFEDLMPSAGQAMPGMIDFDVSEGMAYQFGDFRYPYRAGTRASEISGRHLTVIEKIDEWQIRAQVVIPEAGVEFPDRAPRSRTQLRTLTPARISRGPLRCVQEMERRDSNLSREERGRCHELERKFGAVNAVLTNWTDAWRRNDVDEATGAFAEHSLLVLPGEEARIGRAQIGPQLQRTLDEAGDLHASIVDFTSTGELAYAYGRYFCACRPAPQRDELGHYVAVVKADRDEWRIRALAMWVDPSETQPQ